MLSSRSPSDTYLENGFYLHPEPILPVSLIRQTLERIPALLNKEYDMGVAPWRQWNVGEPLKVQKIDQVHLCDKAFYLLSTQTIVGEWVARITGAELVQIFSTQLFLKPPGGGEHGVIGWHTDREYWHCWEGEVLTVWLALDDVGHDSGPVLYIAGSHRWPESEKQGDAYTQDLGSVERRLKQRAPARDWREVPALLRAGGAGFHSADTLHGSGANETNTPRIGLAISVRTDRARIKPGEQEFDFASYLKHPFICPIIYRRC